MRFDEGGETNLHRSFPMNSSYHSENRSAPDPLASDFAMHAVGSTPRFDLPRKPETDSPVGAMRELTDFDLEVVLDEPAVLRSPSRQSRGATTVLGKLRGRSALPLVLRLRANGGCKERSGSCRHASHHLSSIHLRTAGRRRSCYIRRNSAAPYERQYGWRRRSPEIRSPEGMPL